MEKFNDNERQVIVSLIERIKRCSSDDERQYLQTTLQRLHTELNALYGKKKKATSSRDDRIPTQRYDEVKLLACRIDKCIATTPDQSYYQAVFARMYALLGAVAEKGQGKAKMVANSVSRTCDYHGGVVARCSEKQSWILAMECIRLGINL